MDRDTFYTGTRSYVKTASNTHTRSDSNNILRGNRRNSMLKSPWSFSTPQVHREDSMAIISGLSWPPRSYTCSFCKREFRSAQALGGHMNVHRRDRARLRQSSPSPDHDAHFLSLNPNPNPNPNPYASPNPRPALNNPYPDPDPNPNPNPNPKDTLSPHGRKYPLFPPQHLLHSSPLAPSSSSSSTAIIDKHPMEVHKLGSATNQQPEGLSLTKAIIAKSFLRAEEFDYWTKGEAGSILTRESDCVRLDLEIGVAGDCKEILDLELRLGTSS